MSQDIRYCFRTLWKNPGLMAVAIVSLGLGIGLNLTVFGVFESMFLAGVTASDPGRTFHVLVGGSNRTSYPNFRDLRESNAVAELAGYGVMEFETGTGEERNKEFGQAVTGRYFEMLGIQPATGRRFTADEQKPERNAQVAILSNGYWHRRYSADPKALGETIHLNGKPFTIVGVLPKSYRSIHGMGIEPPIYVPYSNALNGDMNDRAAPGLELLMKVAPGVSRQQASAALLSAAKGLERLYPDVDKEFSRIRSYAIQGPEFIERDGGGMMLLVFSTILMALVGLILLIACANVAGLLVARAVNQRKEIAVRLAIGASRGRIIRLFLTESMVLTVLGAGAAAVFSAWALRGLAVIRLPIEIPMEFRVEPNWHVLLYVVLVAAATALMCGIGPGLEAARANVSAGLKNETGTPRHYRLFTLRNMLVTGQVSGSLLLLVISLLFVRSLQKVQTVDPGFNVANQLIATIRLDNPQAQKEKSSRLIEEAIDSLVRTAGVRSASAGLMVPLTGNTWTTGAFPDNDQSRMRTVQGNSVAARYFETMGIAVVRGREIQNRDTAAAPRVAVVNQTCARQLFGGQNAVGRTLGIPGEPRIYEIVGVAADSKYESLGEGPTPVVYLACKQGTQPFGLSLHIRTEGPAAAMTVAVRSAIRQLEPSANVEVKTMQEITAFSTVPNRVGAALLGTLGALGLMLASMGLYGVLANAVSQRTREIGIRVALGASRSQVLRIILGDAMTLVGIGVAIGLMLALAATRPLSSFLSAGVSVTDPVTISLAALVLGVTGAGAALVPARRALRVDPMTALRYD